MRVILAGGGTAGHINPALSIARCISAKEESAQILFVGCENGMEASLVPKDGFAIEFIRVEGLKRSLSPKNVWIVLKALKACRDSKKIISRFKPDIVIGTGGYVCGPVLAAACAMKIPTIIHEQNVPPGMVVRMLTSRVSVTAISFEQTRDLLKNPKSVVLTGNPIRESILTRQKVNQGRPMVMLSGGSLGAQKLNDTLLELLELPGQEYYDLTASVGERYYDGFMKKVTERGIKIPENKKILPYIYDMDKVLGEAAVAVTRAGAITISELCAIGKPAILIPSPNVAHDQQLINARYAHDAGAAVMITEDELSAEHLAKRIKELLSDGGRLEKMGMAGRKIGLRDASERIYEIAKKLTS